MKRKRAVGIAGAASVFLTVAAVCSVRAQNCYWTGGAGDLKWSSAGNWTNATGEAVSPLDGDRLVITADDAPVVTSNDVADIRLAGIWIRGGTSVTITGERYVLLGNYGTGDSTKWPLNEDAAFCAKIDPNVSQLVVTNLTDIVLAGNATICTPYQGYFGGRLSATDAVTQFRLESSGSWPILCSVQYMGDIDAPQADLYSNNGGRMDFYGRVRVKDIWYPQPASNTWSLYLYAASNAFDRIQIGKWGSVNACVADAYPTNLVFRWYFNYAQNDGIGYNFYRRQTIDHIEGDFPVMSGTLLDKCIVQGNSGAELTMRGTSDALSYARLQGTFDLIWDPVAAYTHAFRDRISSFSGAIRVKRGTFVSGGTNVFTGVKSIEVAAGAAFDIASTNATRLSFPAVTKVSLAAGARLYLTNGCVNAFTASAVDVALDPTAQIVLGSGATVPTFKSLTVGGVVVPPGSYAGSSGASGATVVPWLSGATAVTVAGPAGNYWKRAADGDWNEADNWTLGVPVSGQQVYVAALGGDYTVRMTEAIDQTFDLYAGNVDHDVRLRVESGLTNAAHALRVMSGACVDIPDGSACLVSGNAPITVGAGGELRVSGGTLCLTNSASKYLTFAGENAKTATVSVTAGTLLLSGNVTLLTVPTNGLLKVSGTGRLVCERVGGWDSRYITPTGGRIEIGGEGLSFLKGYNYYHQVFGSGETEFGESALFDTVSFANQLGVRDTLGTGARLTFRDHARLSYSWDTAVCVGGSGGRAVLTFASDAVHGVKTDGSVSDTIGNKWEIGCDSGYGELNVLAGRVPMCNGRGNRFGGTTAGNLDGRTASPGCTGVCQVAGGCLYVQGIRTTGWYTSGGCMPCGLLFGYGALTLSTEGRPYNGFMNVSGGVVTNRSGDTVIGAGFGYGEWRQTGGETQLRTTGVRVGVVGGEGRLILSGGTFCNNGDAYVGGAGTNAFGEAGALFVSYGDWPIHRHDAIGSLVVSGGVFRVTRNDKCAEETLYVGVDGVGTVEMAGAQGRLETPCLVLSNTLAEAGTAYETQTRATLRFVPDATGAVSPVTVTKKATVSPGSKLEVDLSACPERFSGRLRLIDGPVTGTFAEEDVTLTGPRRLVARSTVKQTAGGVSLAVSQGLSVIFR